MIKKKKTTRKKSSKSGMSTLSKVLIGGAVAGGLYLIYDQFFSAKADNNNIDDQNKIDDGTNAAGILDTIIPGSQGGGVIINDSNKRKLSAIGTPGSKQNWGMLLYKGDKGGEIETLQSLFNRISKVYKKKGIKVDGIFGPKTDSKRISIIGGKPGITLSSVYKLTKNVESSKNSKAVVNTPPSNFDNLPFY